MSTFIDGFVGIGCMIFDAAQRNGRNLHDFAESGSLDVGF
jgi:hypothetical protein